MTTNTALAFTIETPSGTTGGHGTFDFAVDFAQEIAARYSTTVALIWGTRTSTVSPDGLWYHQEG